MSCCKIRSLLCVGCMRSGGIRIRVTICVSAHGIHEWVVKVVLDGAGWSEQLGQRRTYRAGDVLVMRPGFRISMAQIPIIRGQAWLHVAGDGVQLPAVLPRV